MLTTPPDGLANDRGWRLCPDKRSWVVVPMLDVVLDVADEPLHRHEGSASNGLACEDAEPRFDHVEPRRAGRREVKSDVGGLHKPRLHIGRLVGRRVVENHVEFPTAIMTMKHFGK